MLVVVIGSTTKDDNDDEPTNREGNKAEGLFHPKRMRSSPIQNFEQEAAEATENVFSVPS